MPDLDPRIILAQRQLPTLADMQDEQQKRQIQAQEVELRRQEILARRDAIIEAAQRRNQVAQPKPLTPKDEMEAQDLRVKQAVMVGNLLEGATDDDSYEQAKQGIAQIVGPDYVQHLPQTFDPAANARLVAQGKALVAKTAAATGLVRTEIPDPTDPTKTVQTWIRPTENMQLPVPTKVTQTKTANLGSFEDYVQRTYGAEPTSAQILEGRKKYNQADDKATSAGGGTNDALVASVLANPSLYATLPPTTKKNLIPALDKMGFDFAAAGAGKPLTKDQSDAAGYARRVEDAEETLNAVQKDIAGMGLISFAAQSNLPPKGQSAAFQQYDQSARNFINAVLRRESGAAISQSEFDNARRQYLPQPGDKPETLELKRKNRETTLGNLISAGGPAYKPREKAKTPPKTVGRFTVEVE